MPKQGYTATCPTKLRDRSVPRIQEHRADYSSDTAAHMAIAPKLGCSPDSLRAWCQRAQRDIGQRAGLTISEKDRMQDLEHETRELRQAKEILQKGAPSERRWSA